jgi:ABC-type transport system substrate-binding protein
MDTGYWDKPLTARITRRRALAATGATGLAAAFAAACGGGSSDGASAPGKEPTSGLLAKREDTTKQAKRGGTLKLTNPADPPHFDPHLLTLPASGPTSLIFNRLLSVKPGILQTSDGTIEPEMAESWEFSPDKTTLTMKIRPNVGTPPMQAPLNGRNLDAQDVLFSWNRWKTLGTNRFDLVNEVNPAAPVVSMTAPDARTVVIKLKEPISSILAGFAQNIQGQYFILPKEADGGFDVRRSPMGGGTYYLSEYLPSSRLVYTRNPNHYNKDIAFAEKMESPIISESAQVVAQLTSGGIHMHYTTVSADSVMQVKRDAPAISLYQTDMTNVGVTVFFGVKATPPERTPFRDLRVRQAYSMSIDRDLYIDTFRNVSKLKKEGIEINTAWVTALGPADYKGWWLDPQGKDFGPNAQFYKNNVAEAKKLLAAAGFATGVNVISNQVGTTDYGLDYARQIEVLEGFAGEAGFKFEKKIQGYSTNWNPEFRDSRGFFEGIAYRATPIPPEPGDALYVTYNKNGSFYYGFDPDGKGVTSAQGPFAGDPMCDDLTTKIRSEFDDSKRKNYAHDLQRHLGKQQYFQRAHGASTGLNVAWPAVRNFGVFSGPSWGWLWRHYWIDETQPPLKT